jgi:hypothetical protein
MDRKLVNILYKINMTFSQISNIPAYADRVCSIDLRNPHVTSLSNNEYLTHMYLIHFNSLSYLSILV